MHQMVLEIKAQLDDFEKIVFDCKTCPENVYDDKNINLCEKAHILNRQLQRAIALGEKYHDKSVIPTNKLIANHLKVSRQRVDKAMKKIRSITAKTIAYSY